MKIFHPSKHLPVNGGRLTQTWRIMRLLTLLLLVASMQISAKAYTQSINLKATDMPLKTVFSHISEQSPYSFFINHALLEKARPVTVSLKNATITEALKACLKGQPFTFSIVDETVVLHLKKSPPPDPVPPALPAPEVSGLVKDSATGRPLIGVTVQEKNGSAGVVTDAHGHFSIAVADDAVLVVSYVGFQTKEIAVNGRQSLEISLNPAVSALEQLVVVGYGSQKKSDLTGSIASLRPEDFAKGVSSSLDQMIQGKVAGVQVVQNSAEPGGGVSVSIRGASSINAGTGPLYVVDGLPLNNNPAIANTGQEFVGTRSPRNPLATINPADIESIEVLKDASATAIYGSRGANGVILITTKKGAAGKLKINYNAYFGVQNVAHKIDLLSAGEYKKVLNGLIADGAATDENTVGEIQGGGTDWQSAIFQKNAQVQSHNLSFTGGGEKTNYYVSLSYFDQDGVVRSSGFKRYSARLNLTMYATDRLEVGLNLNTSYSINDYVPIGFGINGEAGTIYTALNFDPTLPITDAEGNYTISPFLDMDNPLAQVYGKNALSNTYRTYGTVYGKYTLAPGLVAKLNLGGDVLSERKDVYINRLTRHGAPQGGIATILQGQKSNFLVEGTVTYDRSFKQHHLTAMLGATTQRFITDNTNMNASGFPADATGTLNIGLGNQATYGLSSGKQSNRLLSYLGRVNYAYRNKYLLTASFRVDGSSRFGAHNRFGYFPSFAAAWKINEEDFMQQAGWISTLKLRASWGQTGNQAIGNYAALTTFASGGKAILDNNPVSTTVPARLPNPDLKWETTEQTDVGLDFGLFDERISGSVDYYNKRTFDMLLNLPVPTSSGFSSRLTNIGSIRNIGWEFTLNSRNIQGPFQWQTQISLATLSNKVLNLGGIDQIITGGAGQTSQPFLIQPGMPLYAFYGYAITGVWQQGDDFSVTHDNVHPGDLKFKDVNGDGTVNAEDRVPLGNSFPRLTWSLGNTFIYKDFELDVFIAGNQHVHMLNNNLVDAYFPVQFRRNRFAEPYLNRWTPAHPSNKYPSFVHPTSQGTKTVNSYTVEDASYARLKTVTLRYRFSGGKLFEDASVYVTGENLLLLTGYSGYDPAVNPNGNVFRRIDFNAYPVARTFMVGLSVNF